MPLRNTRFQSARLSMGNMGRSSQMRRVGRLLGLNQHPYNPNQWSQHVNSANAITNLRNPPGGVLMSIRRYWPVKITRRGML